MCQGNPVLLSSCSVWQHLTRPPPQERIPRKVDYREEISSSMGGSKGSQLYIIVLLFVHPLGFNSPTFYLWLSLKCLLSRWSVNARPPSRRLSKEWQLTQSQNILTGLNPVWLRWWGNTELSCRRWKRIGLHADGKTKPQRAPQRKIKPMHSAALLLIKTPLW